MAARRRYQTPAGEDFTGELGAVQSSDDEPEERGPSVPPNQTSQRTFLRAGGMPQRPLPPLPSVTTSSEMQTVSFLVLLINPGPHSCLCITGRHCQRPN